MSSDESTQRAPPKTKAIHLVCSLPGASTIRMPLDETTELVFGRVGVERVDIAVDDPHVSRRHALVSRLGGVVCVRDLGSENGTLVGEERIHSSERRIRAGDTFEVGAMRVVVASHEANRAGGLVVADPVMRKLHAAALRIARRGTTVLLVGEPGVGKSTFAECIHDASTRAEKAFVRAVAPAPLDSLIERAQGGTLHVANIDALTAADQQRVLQAIGVRLICSSAAVGTGSFYERIATLTIAIPPLRERRIEIPALAAHFLRQIAAPFDAEPPVISPEAEAKLSAHSWPGNVSDLRDVMEYAFAFADDSRITPADLPASFGSVHPLPPSTSVLRFTNDGFSVSEGPEITRRFALRRILLTLAKLKRPLSAEELFAAGWPGETAVHQTAEGRVRTAIWTLRKMGLDVKTTVDGYALDDTIRVEFS